MAGCFNNSAHDRWIESQVDAYCEGPEARKQRRLTPGERQRLDDMGLDEKDVEEDEEHSIPD